MPGRSLVSVALLAGASFAISASQGDLPDGAGKATVEKVCTTCHGADAIVAMRNTETGWKQTVDDMISRGAEGSDEEMQQVVAYLTKYFGRLNVNRATQAQLQDFLGLPENEAKAILAYREHNGEIKNLEQLKSVPGVSAKTIQDKSDLIAFSQ